MLLTNILNRNGPSIDPSGTPVIMSFHRTKLSFTPVIYKHWCKYRRIYLREVIQNP